MGKVNKLDNKILLAAQEIGVCWSEFNPISEEDNWSSSNSIWEFGGYNATRIACGLPLDAGDLDFFLRDPATPQKNMNATRKKIGHFMHARLCRFYNVNPYAIKKVTTTDGLFFNFKINNNDYTIGSRKIYSNFQVTIDLKTHDVIFDTKNHPTHEQDFERYKNLNEIITYDFDALITNAKNTPDGFTVLSWVLKSYIKPLKEGKHFSVETADNLLKLKRNHYQLYTNIKHDCMSYYGIHELDFDNIFETAREKPMQDAFEAKLNAKDSQIQALALKNHEIQQSLDVEKAKSQHIQGALDIAQSDIAHFQSQLQSEQSTLKSLQGKLENVEKEFKTISIEHARLELTLQNRNDKIKELEGLISSQLQKIEKLDQQLVKITKQKETFAKNVKDIKNELDSKASHVQALEKQVKTLTADTAQYASLLEDKSQSHSNVQKEREEMKAKNKQLESDLHDARQHLKQQEEQEKSAMMMAMFMKSRLTDASFPYFYTQQALDQLNSTYKKLKEDSSKNNYINLCMASALLTFARSNPVMFTTLYNMMVDFIPQTDSPADTKMLQLMIRLDFEFSKYMKGNVKAVDRFNEIRHFVYAMVQFINTPYFQENNPEASSLRVNNIRDLSHQLHIDNNETDKFKLDCLSAQIYLDRLTEFLDKHAKMIADFFDMKRNNMRMISADLVKVLENFFLLSSESLLPNLRSQIVTNAISAFCIKYCLMETKFPQLIELYHEAKHEKDIQLTRTVFDDLHKQYFNPPKGAQNEFKNTMQNKKAFIRDYFKAVYQRFPTADLDFLIKTYFIHLKALFLQNKNADMWMGHPLVEALSVIFSFLNKADLIDPRYRGILIQRAKQELQFFSPFPAALTPNLSVNQNLVLATLIKHFLEYLPKDNSATTSSFFQIHQYLTSDCDEGTASPALFSRAIPLLNESGVPLNQQAYKANLFMNEYFTLEATHIQNGYHTELVQLGQHIAEFSDETIKGLAAFIRDAYLNNTLHHMSTACAFYSAILGGDLEKAYVIPVAKWAKFFKEVDILNKVGLACHESINNVLVPLSIRISVVYPDLIKVKSALAILYANIDHTSDISATENYKQVFNILKRLPSKSSKDDFFDLLCYVAFEEPAKQMQVNSAKARMLRLVDLLYTAFKEDNDTQPGRQRKHTGSLGFEG